MTDAMPPNFGGRSFVKKLCPRKSGAEMRKMAMPQNSEGWRVSYAPENQRNWQTAILL